MREHIETENIKGILEETPFSNYKIEEIHSGVSTNVFKLVNSETYYLKLFSNSHSLPAIVLANKLLLQEDINVPEIQYFTEEDNLQDSRNFYIEEELRGKPVKKDSTLSKEQKDKIIMEAGKDLAKINSIPVDGVGWIKGVKEGKLYSNGRDYNDFILKNVRDMLNGLSNINVLSNKQTEEIEKYIANHQASLNTEATSYLAHGDFCVEHIYHLDGNYSGIIDFGDIRGTSRYHDLAHFYTYNRKYFESLIKGYNSVYELPSDYIQKIIIEAVVFGVGKLWWISKNMPNKLNNHPALKLFDECVY
jgi:aminoglycoside phosphotransferase (APT) family kinase protein